MTADFIEQLRAYPPGSLTESQLEEVWEPLLAVVEAADRMMNEPYQASIDNAAVGLRQRLVELRRAVEAAGKEQT